MHNLEIFTTPWVLTICAVLFAAFIRGVAGFGFSLILAPILLLTLNPITVVVINLFLGLLSNVLVSSYSFKKVNLRKILPMIISSSFGIPIGTWIITLIPPLSLKILIGGVTVICAIPLALGFRKTLPREKLFSGISGFFSGVLSSSTSLGGPPVVLFLHSQNWEKEAIHPTLAVYFSFICSWSLLTLSFSDLVDIQTIMNTASLIPALIIGTGLGIMVFRKINARYFKWVSMVIVICTGILGILSGAEIFP
ncbi:sulfite exporter TauE/SafE family protein [Chloroflexota bacterium]